MAHTLKQWQTTGGQRIYQVLQGRCNCFVLAQGNHYLLIDTGREHAWPELRQSLDRLGIDEHGLDALVLTHTHFDHAENAARVKERYHAPLLVHKNEAEYVKRGDTPLPAGTMFFTRWLLKLFRKKLQPHFRYRPVEADMLIEDRYDLRERGFEATLIHTPGHSAGSISLIVEHEIAIVGDAMFGVVPWSIYPPFADDPRQMIRSWNTLLDTGCSTFLPAHGSPNSRALVQHQYAKYHEVEGQ